MKTSRWKNGCSRTIERLHARLPALDYRSSRNEVIVLYKNREGTLCWEDGTPVNAGQLASGTSYTVMELQ